ncbi:unnamed protein product [Triticum turgidum subsp. durum]|uniref:Homeobox domain-containing protein n=1 Tax=Triticum turgidum subsp. durum TaxID=4567 RepID=A0A9R0SU45_TRITD|nr:unnamed protein product [Triticum turgidum subsp. durum]
MSNYYSSPGDERDPQTMYSPDTGNASYPVPSALGILLYSNNASSGPYTEFSGIIQPQQNFMELHGHPSEHSSSREPPNMVTSLTEQSSFAPVKDMRNEMLMHFMDGAQSGAGGGDLIHNDAHSSAQLDFGLLNNPSSASVPSAPGQGLSLSLNTHILAPSYPYWSPKPDLLTTQSYQGDENRMKNMQSEASRAIRNSKYLKAAQELLDEIVSVWKSIKQNAQKDKVEAGKMDGKDADEVLKSEGVSSNPQESTANAEPEISAAEKQELQNKMAKLLAMLDETISRHFRCLKDAINDQVNVIRKKLGEEDSSSGREGKLTRLRYIDQQLRQQRAFQQYGMLPQNAWRPQRGLPENSVSILRAWLFEHFLHPYPKDSEKLMLARQTGLTRSQISNWFINARVRLWKPMIEDMYKEETGEAELDSNSSSDNLPRSKDKMASCEDKEDLKCSMSQGQAYQTSEFKANMEMAGLTGAPPSFHSEANSDDGFMNLLLKDQRPGEADGGLLHGDESARFMAYHLAELGGYQNSNVSLTLGLQHAENSLSAPNAHRPGFTAGGGEEDIYNTTGAHPGGGDAVASSDYEPTNQLDQRQQFEPSPLLHDFVA